MQCLLLRDGMVQARSKRSKEDSLPQEIKQVELNQVGI